MAELITIANPLKQGLKPALDGEGKKQVVMITIANPLKQGLKLFNS